MEEEALTALAETCVQLPALKELNLEKIPGGSKHLATHAAGQSMGALLAMCPALEKSHCRKRVCARRRSRAWRMRAGSSRP